MQIKSRFIDLYLNGTALRRLICLNIFVITTAWVNRFDFIF